MYAKEQLFDAGLDNRAGHLAVPGTPGTFVDNREDFSQRTNLPESRRLEEFFPEAEVRSREVYLDQQVA